MISTKWIEVDAVPDEAFKPIDPLDKKKTRAKPSVKNKTDDFNPELLLENERSFVFKIHRRPPDQSAAQKVTAFMIGKALDTPVETVVRILTSKSVSMSAGLRFSGQRKIVEEKIYDPPKLIDDMRLSEFKIYLQSVREQYGYTAESAHPNFASNSIFSLNIPIHLLKRTMAEEIKDVENSQAYKIESRRSDRAGIGLFR